MFSWHTITRKCRGNRNSIPPFLSVNISDMFVLLLSASARGQALLHTDKKSRHRDSRQSAVNPCACLCEFLCKILFGALDKSPEPGLPLERCIVNAKRHRLRVLYGNFGKRRIVRNQEIRQNRDSVKSAMMESISTKSKRRPPSQFGYCASGYPSVYRHGNGQYPLWTVGRNK